MEGKVLQERLGKLFDRNEPSNTMETMPKDLEEAFNVFVEGYSKSEAFRAMGAVIECHSIEPVLSGTFAQGFWLGHDYALEHGQLRGD